MIEPGRAVSSVTATVHFFVRSGDPDPTANALIGLHRNRCRVPAPIERGTAEIIIKPASAAGPPATPRQPSPFAELGPTPQAHASESEERGAAGAGLRAWPSGNRWVVSFAGAAKH